MTSSPQSSGDCGAIGTLTSLPWNSLSLATHQRQASDFLRGDVEIKTPTRSDTPCFLAPFSSTMIWTMCAQVQELSLLPIIFLTHDTTTFSPHVFELQEKACV